MPWPRRKWPKKTGSDRCLWGQGVVSMGSKIVWVIRSDFYGRVLHRFVILLLGVVGLVWLVVWLVCFFWGDLAGFSHPKKLFVISFPAVGWNNLRLVGTTCGGEKKQQQWLHKSTFLLPWFVTSHAKVQVVVLWHQPKLHALLLIREIPSKHTMQHVLTSTWKPPLKKKGWHFMTPNLPPPTTPPQVKWGLIKGFEFIHHHLSLMN